MHVLAMDSSSVLSFFSLLLLLSLSPLAEAVRFVLSREECFTENVEYDGDMVHVSFVVISYEHAWNYHQEASGIDLSVRSPPNFPSPCSFPLLRLLKNDPRFWKASILESNHMSSLL
jgi:hypothetical protein